jgi:hypothetical protein
MYTGPFFRPWNDALRFGTGIKDWATSLAVLSNAIMKLAIVAQRTTVFRGVDESKRVLPAHFFDPEPGKFPGGIEFGFMSTTGDIDVAYKYSGGHGGKGTVFQIQFDIGNRAANIQFLSQYLAEKEWLWPPSTSLTFEVDSVKQSPDGFKRTVGVRASIQPKVPGADQIVSCQDIPRPVITNPTKAFSWKGSGSSMAGSGYSSSSSSSSGSGSVNRKGSVSDRCPLIQQKLDNPELPLSVAQSAGAYVCVHLHRSGGGSESKGSRMRSS